MTRERLRQYENLCAELREDAARLHREIREVTAAEYVDGVGNLFGDAGISRTRTRVAELSARRETEAERIRVWIETVPDSLTRRAFKLRYVDGLPWETVALRLGYTGESSARMLCDRFMDSTAPFG